MHSYDSIFHQKLAQRLEEELKRQRESLEQGGYTNDPATLGVNYAISAAEIRTLKSVLAWAEEVRVEMNSPEK